MWGAIVGGAISLLGGVMGNRNAERERETSARENELARQFAASQGATARRAQLNAEERASRQSRKTEARNLKYQREAETRARRYMRQDEKRGLDLSRKARNEARAYSQNLAKSEREQVLKDEATRFTRLRESAEKGGFNPLTVMGAGFVGAGVPTGLISSGDALVGTSQGFSASGYVSNTASSIQIGQGAALAAEQPVSRAVEVGLSASAMSIEAQAALAASSATRQSLVQQGTSNLINSLTSGISLGMQWDSDRRAARLAGQQQQLDVERYELDREAMAQQGQRSYHNYQNPVGTRQQPAFGSTSAAVVNHPTIGDVPPNALPMNPDGTIADRDLLVNGSRFRVDETTSPAQYFEDEYGDVASSIVGLYHAAEDGYENYGSSTPFAFGLAAGQATRRWVNNVWDNLSWSSFGNMADPRTSSIGRSGSGRSALRITVDGT